MTNKTALILLSTEEISKFLINIIKKYNKELDDDYINLLVYKANEFIKNRKLRTFNEQMAYYDFSKKFLTNLYEEAFKKLIIPEKIYNDAISKINHIFNFNTFMLVTEGYSNNELMDHNDEKVKALVDDYTKKYMTKD